MSVCANFVYYFKTIIFFTIEAKLTFELSIRNFDLASLFFCKEEDELHFVMWMERQGSQDQYLASLIFAIRRIILCYVEAKINTELAEF